MANPLPPRGFMILNFITSAILTITPAPHAPKSECQQVARYTLAAGLPANQIAKALNVAWRESRCQHVRNTTDANGGSHGWYQINGFWCQPSRYYPQGWLQSKGILETCHDLYLPEVQAAAMVAIWKNSGWNPWRLPNE